MIKESAVVKIYENIGGIWKLLNLASIIVSAKGSFNRYLKGRA